MDTPKFDNSNFSTTEKNILSEFGHRRILVDRYIKDKKLGIFTCPGCGYPTLGKRNSYEICEICSWEDDGQDDENSDEIWGGPNSNLSLTESRLIIGKKLKNLANIINLKLITSPEKVFEALDKRDNELRSFVSNKVLFQISKDDPVHEQYKLLKKDTIKYLFENE